MNNKLKTILKYLPVIVICFYVSFNYGDKIYSSFFEEGSIYSASAVVTNDYIVEYEPTITLPELDDSIQEKSKPIVVKKLSKREKEIKDLSEQFDSLLFSDEDLEVISESFSPEEKSNITSQIIIGIVVSAIGSLLQKIFSFLSTIITLRFRKNVQNSEAC